MITRVISVVLRWLTISVVAYPRGELKEQAAGNMKSPIVSRDTIGNLLRKDSTYEDGAPATRPNKRIMSN